MTTKINPDKEIWEKAGFPNNPRYEQVPLSKEVARMLKRKYKDFVLISYYWTDDEGRKTAFLEYISYERGSLRRGPGYCNDRTDDPEIWSQLAKNIAADCEEFQTKSFRKLSARD